MVKLIPMPKKIEETGGEFLFKAIKPVTYKDDLRIEKAFSHLVQSADGAEVNIIKNDGMGDEEYRLELSDKIIINAKSERGIFYAVQTLRQLFEETCVPCCIIEDKPDLSYRGFYHDVTRGKIPTLETFKKLVDKCAYFKLNSLQLYVEHTYEFKEYKDIKDETGYMTAEETKAIDDYCYENFIELVPSLSTFGHLYELLNLKEYEHLRVLKDYKKECTFWHGRMMHHTIDPRLDESFEVIKSLIDQYLPLFRSDKFNICCDETFDLDNCGLSKEESGKLYIEFVLKIINYVKSKGKTPMMWGDILLQHPEAAKLLPEDVILLNWDYDPYTEDKRFEVLEKLGRKQISCPGTSSWYNFCEIIDKAEKNICNMAYIGARHGIEGLLNTNWGDHGNVCSIELAMYGLALGADEAWTPREKAREDFGDCANALIYKSKNGSDFVRRIGRLCQKVSWRALVLEYSYDKYGDRFNSSMPEEEIIRQTVKEAYALKAEISADNDLDSAYKKEMLIAVDGELVMSKIFAKRLNADIDVDIDFNKWLDAFKNAWLEKNQVNELPKLEKLLMYFN